MIDIIINLILLCGALLGLGVFAYRMWGINPSFLPMFIFSSIVTILFFAGIFNILPHIVYAIYYLGLLLSAFYIIQLIKRKFNFLTLLTPSNFIFLLGFIGVLFLLRGSFLFHYDNFSHWGLIVKEMLRIDGLPDATTSITFRNYPPGTAIFIYFITKLLENKESIQLMAQSFLMMAGLSVLAAFSQWKKPTSILLIFATCFSILLLDGSVIYSLLVDILLGIVALSITVIAYYYRGDWKKSVLVNTPILILLVLVKDSGKLFLIFNIALILYYLYNNLTIEQKSTKYKLRAFGYALMFILAIPASISLLWIKYTEKVYFSVYNENKFAITSDEVLEISKSEETVRDIRNKLITEAANIDNGNVLLLFSLLFAAILMITFNLYMKKGYKRLFYSTIYVIACYIIYLLSLYFMYIFMMPENEAISIAGFDRYLSTIILYCVGILMIALIFEWIKWSPKIKSSIVKSLIIAGLALIFIFPNIQEASNTINKYSSYSNVESSIRMDVHEYYQKLSNDSVRSPMVAYYSPQSKGDKGYLKYVLNYEQLNKKFSILYSSSTKNEQESLLKSIKASDFLVIVKSDPYIKEFLSDWINEEQQLEGIYKVQVSNDNITLIPIK